jgi:hypothetical protein
MAALFGRSGNDLLREVVQIGFQVLDRRKLLALTPIQRANADASRCSQGLQLAGILRFPLLNQPQSLTQDFAGILIAAGFDEGLDEF